MASLSCSVILFHEEMCVPLLNLHVSLAADVTKKKSTTDKCMPAVEDQKDAKGGDDETTEEELCSTSAVLGNIPETLSQEFLELLVEKISRDLDSPSTSQTFTLEVIPVTSSAVVKFQSGKGIH